MTLEGSFASLERLEGAAASLARVPALASLEVAKGIQELIGEEFSSGTDPYGTAWEPLADATLAKGRHEPPLTDTGGLHDSLNVYARRGGGVALSIGRPGHPAAPHQTGWSGKRGTGPARPILPERAEIPATWEFTIEEAVKVAVEAQLGSLR
jgi:hypothetical protein